jgi:uncharacterized protein (DUF885 family)
MTVSRRTVLGSAGAAATLATLPAFAAPTAESRAEALLAAIAEERLADSPESAAALGLDTGRRGALRGRLNDRSASGQRRVRAHLKARLADIAAFDRATLSPTLQTHLDVVRASYELGAAGMAFPYGDVSVGGWRNSPYVVCQNVGAFLDVPRLLDSTHKVEDAPGADAYLARLSSYARQLDGETERLKAATAQGVMPSAILLDKALKQIAASRSGDVASWDLFTSLTRRTVRLTGNWNAQGLAILTDAVRPALLRQEAELKRQRALSDDRAGVWKLPRGDEYYAWALSAGTTTTMTPDQVHAMGLEELKRLQDRMDGILKGLGLTQGSVAARMTALGQDPKYGFPNDDAGRAQIMALLTTRVADMRAMMPRAFRTLVKGNVEVKRLPLAEEPGAAGAYGGAGSIDGTIPGRLWINLRTTDLWTRYSLPTLAYHESIPGHAWQGEYTHRMPLIRTLLEFNAYSEGWALYSEQLADELGVYDDDPVGRLGYLQSIAFRACRLVVDTGLHAKRWTRDQAIAWFMEANGSGREEVTGEVDRYCSWPGQACGYKVGHTTINRLRDRAKSSLGARYDLRDFDDAVVLGGAVPMTVLGTIVDRYISGRSSPPRGGS